MSKVKKAVYLQVAAFAVGVAALALVVRAFPVLEYIQQAQEQIAAMGPWGMLLYPLLFALCNILLLPGGVISIGSGLFFGLWWGFAVSLAGSTIGAAVAFVVGRTIGRGWIIRRVMRDRKWAALDEAIGREGWKIVFLSQLHPLFPTSLLCYIYGVTRIPFWRCLLWVTIGQIPARFLYAYLGTLAQFGMRILQGDSNPTPLEYTIWGGGLLLTAAITVALGRLSLRLLAEAEAKARIPEPPLPSPPGAPLPQALRKSRTATRAIL